MRLGHAHRAAWLYPPYEEGEERPIHIAATGVTEVTADDERERRVFEYVALWTRSMRGHARSKPGMGTPRLVMYSAYNPRAPKPEKGSTSLGPYDVAIPALLCDSPEAAAAVYALFVGFKRCAYCGERYERVRKDQTSCGKGKCQVAAHRWRLAHPAKRKRRK